MSDSEYKDIYWPKLRGAVDIFLQGPPTDQRQTIKMEFEPIFSTAYKCVCQQYSENLYQDLMSHLNTHYTSIANTLQVCSITLYAI